MKMKQVKTNFKNLAILAFIASLNSNLCYAASRPQDNADSREAERLSFDNLIQAIHTNNIEQAKALINANVISFYGKRTLIKAVTMSRKEIAKLLIDARADVNSANQFGDTYLMLAETSRDLEIVKLLIEAKADGDTALTRAATCGKIEIVKLLIEYGADLDVLSEDKKAIDYAKEKANDPYYNSEAKSKFQEIIKLLKDEPGRRTEAVKDRKKAVAKVIAQSQSCLYAVLANIIGDYAVRDYQDIVNAKLLFP